jgi:hypothetical protein
MPTFAPTIAAPVLSVTTPLSDVVPVCATAFIDKNRQINKIARNTFPVLENLMNNSFRAPSWVSIIYARMPSGKGNTFGSEPKANLDYRNKTFPGQPSHHLI